MIKESPLFSILIANFNNGIYLEDCFKSILNQTYKNIEVIIVDDNSTDDSVQIIKSLIKNTTNIKSITFRQNDKNYGCGFTKRKCVELSTGSFLGFLDPDDTLEHDAVELMVNKHLSQPNVGLVHSKLKLVDLNLNPLGSESYGCAIPPEKNYLNYEMNTINHFVTFSRFFYLLTDGINPKLKRAVDQDLYLKMEEVSEISFVPHVLYNWRITPNSISCNQNQYKAQYWHFILKKEAYYRRKKIFGNNFLNLTAEEFKEMKYNYWKQRIKFEVKENKIKNKYKLLFNLFVFRDLDKLKYFIKLLAIRKFA